MDALTTSNVYLEMPYTQYASDIETILNADEVWRNEGIRDQRIAGRFF